MNYLAVSRLEPDGGSRNRTGHAVQVHAWRCLDQPEGDGIGQEDDARWMILWPFDAKAAGLSTVMRDAGAMVMFAGTPYAHLHMCGSPWDGNEYNPGDRGGWTMTYARP